MGKTLGLSALAGLASEGASQVVKSISGKGVQSGGFLVPQDKINKLIEFKHLLSMKQEKDILDALKSGSGVHIKPTKTQSGGLLGTLLASIGIPLAIEAIKKMTGKGAPRIGRQTPPFYSFPPYVTGHGKKKRTTKKKSGKGLLLGKNSPFNGIPILGAILQNSIKISR